MGYALGVDLGTTFTAAAIERDGRVDIVPLGNHAATIPSLVFLREDDGVLIGDPAERRGVQHPSRLAREFKRRFGDSTPIMLDRTPLSADRLTAMMLRQIVADVATRQGSGPETVGVAHPANWGSYKIDLLRQAVESAGLARAVFVSEPVAAAIQYASTERVDVGDVIAVYDLGGGTFDAAVLRKTPTGFDTLGQPQGIERLGGIDFDESVFAHVRHTIGDSIDRLDTGDPSVRAAIARLRQECVMAKEALSSDSDATIPVMLPTVQTQVRITRSEFEDMIRPTLHETIETLRRAIKVSGVELGDVKSVLLTGGSSRIPLVAELVGFEFGLPVVTDAHPKHAVAMGAARAASLPASPVAVVPTAGSEAPPASSSSAPASAASEPVGKQTPVPATGRKAFGGPPTDEPPTGGHPAAQKGPRRNIKVLVIGLGLLAVGAGVAVAIARSSDGQSPGGATASGTTAVTQTAPEVASSTASVPASAEVTTTAGPALAQVTTIHPQPRCGASGLCVAPHSISLVDRKYVVEYHAVGFDPLIGAEGTNHVHFFYDTVSPDQAGAPGAGPWAVWDLAAGGGQPIFDGFTLDNLDTTGGVGATQICIAVADFDHSIQLDTVSCMPLPRAPGEIVTTVHPQPRCGASGLCVAPHSISLVDRKYVVEYHAVGFDPLIGAEGTNHVHFFYDTVSPDQAGAPGAGPWAVWDLAAGGGQPIFDGFTLDNLDTTGGVGATQICIAVADFDHSIQLDTVSCMPLPG